MDQGSAPPDQRTDSPVEPRPARAEPAVLARLGLMRGGAPAVIVTLMAVVFVGDAMVMVGLDAWLPPNHSWWLEAVLDAGAITLLCAPFIVYLVRHFRRHGGLALRALDAASDGFWVVDEQGRLRDVNAGYASMSGYTRTELLEMRVDHLDALETPAMTRAHIAQVRASGFTRFDSRHRRRDGSLYDVHITAAWLADLQCFAGFVRDDTARIAAERAVAEQSRHLQRLLDSAAEGIFGMDLQGRFTFINRAALQLLGYTDHGGEAALLGRDVHAAIHHHHSDGRPYPAVECRLFQAQHPPRAMYVDDEVFWRRDGTCFAVAYWSSPVVEDGQVRGAIATFFDISERLRARARLKRTEQRAQDLIDSAMDAIISVDARESIVLFNRAAERMFGVSAEAVLGGPLDRFIPPSARAIHRERVRLFTDHGQTDRRMGRIATLTALRADGVEFPIEASLSRIETDSGPVMTVTVRDVTELQMARDERALHKARTEFLSRVSHELRTPLNAVLGFSQLLRMDTDPPLSPAQQSQVERIHQSGDHPAGAGQRRAGPLAPRDRPDAGPARAGECGVAGRRCAGHDGRIGRSARGRAAGAGRRAAAPWPRPVVPAR